MGVLSFTQFSSILPLSSGLVWFNFVLRPHAIMGCIRDAVEKNLVLRCPGENDQSFS